MDSTPATTGGSTSRLWTRDFTLICLTNLAMFLGLQILMPTLPAYVDYLGGTDFQVGLVIGVFTISAMLVRPLAGFLLDTSTRRGVLFTGLAIFLISALSYNLTAGIVLLLLVRFIHGLGWGCCTTAAGTVAADTVPGPRMGEGMGYFGLATAISMAAAPAAGIYVIDNFSFTVLFNTSAVLVFTAMMLASGVRYRKIERSPEAARPSLFEKKAVIPALVIMFTTTTFGSIVSFLILYAGQKGIENIGPFFTVFALVMLISRPISGIMVDKKGYDVVVIPGLLLVTATMLVLSAAATLPVFILAAALYGLGFGSVQPSMQALAVRYVAPERRGAANSTFFSAFDLGIGAGSMLWGVLAQGAGYSSMYLAAAGPGIIALAVYLFGKKIK